MTSIPVEQLTYHQEIAEHDRTEAEAAKFRAEELSAYWQGRYNEVSYLDAAEGRERAARRRAFDDASDIENRTYHLMSQIDPDSAHACIEFLTRWARQDIDEPVEVKLSTFGGDAFAGMALFDEIQALRQAGLFVRIKVRGTAASMGAILLQAADERLMGPSSTLMLHKVQSVAGGSLDQVTDRTTWLNIMQEQVYDIFADRCAATYRPGSLTRDQIVEGINRRDWAIGPVEAMQLGLIDGIG